MKEKHLSFSLNKIKSKNILKNKVLLNKLDINIKDYYYNTKIVAEKKEPIFMYQTAFELIVIFIPFLVYYIMFYTKGTFNNNNLKKGYNKMMKNFVNTVDKYFVLLFLIYLIITFILFILYEKSYNIPLKGKFKFKCELPYTAKSIKITI